MKGIHADLDGYSELEELALDLIWSWNRSTDTIWEQLDPELFANTHNPWVILQTVSKEKLRKFLSDKTFRKTVDDLLKMDKKCHNPSDTWFQKKYPQASKSCIAYFSMEFMLSEALPIYSGGLGNVAGDQLKAASDLGVPVVGVGLLYQQGYFRQIIDHDGAQQAVYPYNSPLQLPIIPLRKPDGEWLRIEVSFPGWSLWFRAWEVKVGRVKLYLLDSNDAANYPAHRGVTSELYGGDSEMRIKQEIVLGVGGWRLLKMIGLRPEVCHLNEGHAAFAILERAKSCMEENGLTFEEALAATRAGNLFTTHTAVPAGFDRFSPDLIEKYMMPYAKNHLGISHLEDLMALGRENPSDPNEPFNMAYLALRGSGAVNGVSRLHEVISRKIFAPLFPRRPIDEVPIGHVTNGIHTPSWNSAPAEKIWGEYCGSARWLGETKDLKFDLQKVSDERLWNMRNEARRLMIEYGRKRLPSILAARGNPPEEVEMAKHLFDTKALTLGFARRFATYKRPNMLLHDKERLTKILTNPDYPVQLILAGKAHPADKPGQAMIQEWIHYLRRPEIRPHVIFLSDYDVLMAEKLVQGVDVWINTPRRPWEACGTSGMKVLVNGGLNVSELDGWWAEAYAPEVGWAIGDGQEHGDDPAWDAKEAMQLYDLLEKEIIPQFYHRDVNGIPITWIAKVRESMARLTPIFCANRAVRDYTEKHYIPAFENYQKRSENEFALAKKIAEWQRSLSVKWSHVHFGEVKINSLTVEVELHLDGLTPDEVLVELYANGSPPTKIPMKPLSGSSGAYLYQAQVPRGRSPADFCPRAIPQFPSLSTPLEAPQILWQR
ncbi:MAG: alpha-glucan family phosphorylase [Verrucomicrobia bacterium]|nr:alpha-glucan family phosphorylase [Verrucomicrobiota bacterium]